LENTGISTSFFSWHREIITLLVSSMNTWVFQFTWVFHFTD